MIQLFKSFFYFILRLHQAHLKFVSIFTTLSSSPCLDSPVPNLDWVFPPSLWKFCSVISQSLWFSTLCSPIWKVKASPFLHLSALPVSPGHQPLLTSPVPTLSAKNKQPVCIAKTLLVLSCAFDSHFWWVFIGLQIWPPQCAALFRLRTRFYCKQDH